MRCGYQGPGARCEQLPTFRMVRADRTYDPDTTVSCDEHLEWFDAGKHPWGRYRQIPHVPYDQLDVDRRDALDALRAGGALTARQVQRRGRWLDSVRIAELALDDLVTIGWAARVEDADGRVAARYSAIEAPPPGVRCCPPGGVPLTEHPRALEVSAMAVEPVEQPDYMASCAVCSSKLRDAGGVKVTRRGYDGEPSSTLYCLRHFCDALERRNVQELVPTLGMPAYIVREDRHHPWRLKTDVGHPQDWVRDGHEVRRLRISDPLERYDPHGYEERRARRRRELDEAADRFIRGDGVGMTLDFEEYDELLRVVAHKINELISDDFLRRALVAEERVRALEARVVELEHPGA